VGLAGGAGDEDSLAPLLLDGGGAPAEIPEDEELELPEAGTTNTCLHAVLGHCTFLPAALSGTCIDFWQCGQRSMMF